MLKKTIEQNEYSIKNLENKCKTLDDNIKVEKKKNKKERQKAEKKLAEETESKIKVENIESEENSVDVRVPTFNKFETLEKDGDWNERTKGIEKKDLNDHIAKNQTETSDSSAQTFTAITFSRSQQTSEVMFEQYNCFYCGISITSESCLTNHVDKCHGKFKGNSVSDQPIHSQMIAMQRMLSAMQTPKVKCDICYKEFESDGFVQLHKMSEHDTKFAFLKQDIN